MRNKPNGSGQRVSTSLGLVGLILLGGCDSTRETLGMAKHGPDAFASEPLKDHLDVPPSYGVLPAPQDGTGKETDPFPPSPSTASALPLTAGSKALLKTVNPSSDSK